MMGRAFAAAIVLALSAAAVSAQGAAKPAELVPSDYPAEVRESLEAAAKECKDADDGKATFLSETVRKIDLTGDGREDYIVNLDHATCSTFESIYCGTGGCVLEILVALPDGRYRSVFSNPVRTYDILPGRGARTIRFSMHGGYCDTYGAATCYKRKRINDKPFEFKDR